MYKIALELIKNCNLNCRYCYQPHSSEEMDIQTARKAIDLGLQTAISLNTNKVLVSFFGGEPLLRFGNITELVNYAKDAANGLELFFEITTNGTLLNQRIIEFFQENQFFLKISLDGLPYYHDLNRVTISGRESYKLIVRNMDLLNGYQRKLQKPVQVSMVITKNNYAGLLANMKHLLDLGFRMFDTALNFEENWIAEDMLALKSELENAVAFYFEQAKEGRRFIWTFVDNGIIPQIQPRKNYFCGAGIASAFVSTEGELFPCFACFKDEALMGSVQEGFDPSKVERLRRYKRNLNNDCVECDINAYCPACDCLMMNLEQTGDIYTVPPMFCEYAKMRYELTRKLVVSPEWNEVMGR